MQLAQPQCGSIIRFEEHGAVGRQSLGEGFVVMPATGAHDVAEEPLHL